MFLGRGGVLLLRGEDEVVEGDPVHGGDGLV